MTTAELAEARRLFTHRDDSGTRDQMAWRVWCDAHFMTLLRLAERALHGEDAKRDARLSGGTPQP